MPGTRPLPIRGAVTAAVLLVLLLYFPICAAAKKKKEAPAPAPAPAPKLDYAKFVWPEPPAIARIKFLNFFSAEKKDESKAQKKKSGWMDRLAGVAPESDRRAAKPRFELWSPYGLAVDSKGRLYVADSRVGAIFVFNTETRDVEMIKHGVHAQFGWIVGLAVDDNDRVFVSDTKLRHVLVFDAARKLEATIREGMAEPGGLAIDRENRLLYVADAELDQVLVYDADSLGLLRKIGTAGKQHTLTTPGDFSKPTNVAVDQEGNLYVADTLNDRIEVFDADGTFIRTFGKNGDGPGAFARPKGIAIDSDGHVWVADAMLNRLQIFTPEGNLLFILGGFGLMPGQFQALTGVAIDKQNRVFTSEQFPGRVQMFQYVVDAEARRLLELRQAEAKKKAEERNSGTVKPQQPAAAPAAKPDTPAAPAQKPAAPSKAESPAAK